LPPIPFPDGWFSEIDGAAGRQIALGNSPPLHLPPVEHRRGQLNKRRLDVGNIFAVKDAERDFRRLLALSGDDLHWPTNDALPKKGFVVKKDGCVGCPVKPGERTVTLMRHSRRIDIQPNPENRTVWRKVGRILEHLFKGKFIVPSKSHTIREPRSGLGDLVAPPGFARRSTDNDGDGRCLRQDVQDIFKENRIVVRDRHDSIVLGQFIEVHAASLYQSVQHGRRWKEVFAVGLHEIGRRRADGDDQIGRLVNIKSAKILDEWSV